MAARNFEDLLQVWVSNIDSLGTTNSVVHMQCAIPDLKAYYLPHNEIVMTLLYRLLNGMHCKLRMHTDTTQISWTPSLPFLRELWQISSIVLLRIFDKRPPKGTSSSSANKNSGIRQRQQQTMPPMYMVAVSAANHHQRRRQCYKLINLVRFHG